MNALPAELMEQRIECSVAAAIRFQVPANLLLAVAEIENGRPWQRVPNSNGTWDVGPMQFNTRYLESLSTYGIQAKDVAASNCYPFDLAAWRIAGHLYRDTGDLWTRAANYHSRTPVHNAVYRKKLIKSAAKWEDWLRLHYSVREMGR